MAALKESTPGASRAVGQSPQRTLESYRQAFPEADAGALETHLSLAAASSFLTRGIEGLIKQAGFDLSRQRYSIVRMLYLTPGYALAQNEIAQALGVTGANVTQLIDGLVADGWVERSTSSSDRRVTYATLTTAGKARAAHLVPAVVEFMTASCSSLTVEEQAELRRLIEKVRISAESALTRGH
jgi:MarR family transcriptional regulator, 2-MHQ and catechol-resistance regulon repressor